MTARAAGAAVGFLIPEFPQQTHIAWWRVADAMRRMDHPVRMISTTRPKAALRVHRILDAEVPQTFYVWPPEPARVLRTLARHPGGVLRALRYVAGLRQSGAAEKLRLLPLVAAAAGLVDYCREQGIGHVFVHSCANAAHLLALAHEIGGLHYALRLGGDLEVYGKDHDAKMRAADFVVSASPTYLPQLEGEVGVPPERLLWSWVGVDLAKFSPGPGWPDRPAGTPLRLITVARLNPVKGHLDVLEAVAGLRDAGIAVRYTVVGSGPHEAAIREAVAARGLGDAVVLTGSKDTDEIVALLRDADIHVLASFGVGEAAPAAVCEAMAAGLPALCTRIGATPLMIEDGVDGFLVDQHDPAAIRDRLAALAADPARLAAMKRAALAKSRDFDCRTVARTVLERFGIAA
jgi:glycosyltransferase involved in cell wall biosynthesis